MTASSVQVTDLGPSLLASMVWCLLSRSIRLSLLASIMRKL